MKGLIYKSTGSYYNVKSEDGQLWNCRIRGKLKIDKTIKSTNPIAVGDWVNFDIEDESILTGIIKDIYPRENYMVRSSPHNRNQKHIVAANLDQSVLVATITDPKTSFGFIDRFLITAEMYHIPAIIVFNKKDLIQGEYLLDEWANKVAIYEMIGYKTVTISATATNGLDPLKELLAGKTSLISGHSGVGKSTLINALDETLDLRVGEISEYSGKGQHTTTFAEMHDLDDTTKIIDTPGVKEFGLVNIEKEQLAHYFPEMRALMKDCRFNNCVHINEPDCAIKNAVEEGEISYERYESYVGIYSGIEAPNY